MCHVAAHSFFATPLPMDGFSGKYRSILSTGIPANIDWESTIIDFFTLKYLNKGKLKILTNLY